MGVTQSALQLAPALACQCDDSELIRRASRDPDAFGQLYRMHYKPVAAYLYRRIGDEHTAEDLAAETFLAAHRGLWRYRQGSVPFRSWLYRIAANRANRWAKRSAAQARRELEHAGTLEQPGADRDVLEVLRRAIESLPDREKSIITLAHFTPLTTAQVGQALGVPEGTVKSRLSRARANLAAHITRLGGAA